MTIDSELRALSERQSTLTTRKTRAEIEADNAKAKFEDARRVLKEDHNLSSGDEIAAKIEELTAKRDRLMSEIADDLTKAGA